MNAFIHVKETGAWKNFSLNISFTPAIGHIFSMDVTGPIYKILGVMHIVFDSEYQVELYVEEISQTDYVSGL